jgi:hypothetical protein
MESDRVSMRSGLNGYGREFHWLFYAIIINIIIR